MRTPFPFFFLLFFNKIKKLKTKTPRVGLSNISLLAEIAGWRTYIYTAASNNLSLLSLSTELFSAPRLKELVSTIKEIYYYITGYRSIQSRLWERYTTSDVGKASSFFFFFLSLT